MGPPNAVRPSLRKTPKTSPAFPRRVAAFEPEAVSDTCDEPSPVARRVRDSITRAARVPTNAPPLLRVCATSDDSDRLQNALAAAGNEQMNPCKRPFPGRQLCTIIPSGTHSGFRTVAFRCPQKQNARGFRHGRSVWRCSAGVYRRRRNALSGMEKPLTRPDAGQARRASHPLRPAARRSPRRWRRAAFRA